MLLAVSGRSVVSHLAQIPLPETGAPEFEDPAGPGALHEVQKGPVDHCGHGAIPAEPECLCDEFLVEHKTCTFHMYSMRSSGLADKGDVRFTSVTAHVVRIAAWAGKVSPVQSVRPQSEGSAPI